MCYRNICNSEGWREPSPNPSAVEDKAGRCLGYYTLCFLLFFIFNLIICVPVYLYMSSVSLEASRECRIPLKWEEVAYCPICVLRTELKSSTRWMCALTLSRPSKPMFCYVFMSFRGVWSKASIQSGVSTCPKHNLGHVVFVGVLTVNRLSQQSYPMEFLKGLN